MIRADSWADVAGRIWDSDPTARWFIYVVVVVVGLYAVWRLVRTLRPVLIEMRDDLRVTKSQVANDHSTNLRVEQDQRHHENTSKLTAIELKVDRILGILGQHDYRLDALEHTQDRRTDT